MSYSQLGQEETVETVELDTTTIEGPSREEFGQQLRDRVNMELVKVGADPIPVPGHARKVQKDHFGVGIISLLIILFLILS